MTNSLPAERLRKVPVAELTVPRNGMFNVHVDYWWTVTEDDCLLFYRSPGHRRGMGSPQCNRQEAIARKVAESVGYPWPVRVEQVPVVYVPTSPEEYR